MKSEILKLVASRAQETCQDTTRLDETYSSNIKKKERKLRKKTYKNKIAKYKNICNDKFSIKEVLF